MAGDEDEGLLALLFQLFGVLMFFWYWFKAMRWCCYRCGCCRRSPESVQDVAPKTVQVGGETIGTEFLTQKKSLSTAYALWFFSGFLGIHHFYLGRLAHGVVAMWSLNLLSLGWILDAFLLPRYVHQHNERTVSGSLPDRSCGRVCRRAPLAMILVLTVVIGALVKGPRVVHQLGVCDLDKQIAKTQGNPYDILGVPRNTTAASGLADIVYAAKVTAMKTGRACDQECEAQKREMKKAHAFIHGDWRSSVQESRSRTKGKGKRRQQKSDDWDDWSDFIKLEWGACKDCIETVVRNFTAAWSGEEASESSTGGKRRERRRGSRGTGSEDL